MKKIMIASLISIFAASAVFANDANISKEIKTEVKTKEYVQKVLDKEVSLEEFKKNVSEKHFLFQKGYSVKKVYSISDELYVVKATNMVDMRQYGEMGVKEMPFEITMTKNGKANFNEVPISDDKSPLGLKIDLSANKDKAAYTVGNGTEEIYVFTDPDCPYCEQFEKSFVLLDPKYKLYIYLFPLDNHPSAKPKSEYILSLPFEERAEAYKRVQGAKNPNLEWSIADVSKGKELLVPMMKYENEFVGVSGTPYVLDKNGIKINRGSLFIAPQMK